MKVIKIPFCAAALSKSKGQEKAPDHIVAQLDELFANEAGFTPELEFGEIKVDNSNVQDSHNLITRRVSELGCPAVLVGGDHSITFSSFRGFVKEHPGAGLVVFDAHPDCENHFVPPSHEDYLRSLIEEGLLDPKKVIVVGIRNWHKNEFFYLRNKNINVFTMKSIMSNGLDDVCDTVMETVRSWPVFYLSIDIDVLDPAFAPGTGYIEPGGLTSRELLQFVQRLKLLKNLGMADICEVNPDKDVNNITSKMAAKLIKELS